MDCSGSGNGCDIGFGHGGLLGKFGMYPSWVMWNDIWLESIDGPQLGDLEVWLV